MKVIQWAIRNYDCHSEHVHVESTSDIYAAISREKPIKAWSRTKKIALIEATNPTWEDLSELWREKQISRLARNDKAEGLKGGQ